MEEVKLPADVLANPRERLADYIYKYANDLRAYWCRHGIKDGKIYVSASPHIPGARDEVIGTVFGIEVEVELPPQAITASVRVARTSKGFELKFGKTKVQVTGGPVHDWAEELFS